MADLLQPGSGKTGALAGEDDDEGDYEDDDDNLVAKKAREEPMGDDRAGKERTSGNRNPRKAEERTPRTAAKSCSPNSIRAEQTEQEANIQRGREEGKNRNSGVSSRCQSLTRHDSVRLTPGRSDRV